jgi:hypothetical protein
MEKCPNSYQEEMCSNFTTRMQEERLHGNRSCLFLVYFIFVPRVRVFSGFLQTRVSPVLYLSDICVGLKSNNRSNILGNQLRRLDRTLSRTT